MVSRLTYKDLIIGALALVLLLTSFKDYLLPSPDHAVDDVYAKGAVKYAEGYFDYDIVISYYDEALDSLQSVIDEANNVLEGTKRIIVYYKGDQDDHERIEDIAKRCDELVLLENVGREGETYLAHITRHFHSQRFAPHTLFFQPHLAWDWILKPRLKTITKRTGFMALGPYINMTKGVDVHGSDFPRIMDIYSSFTHELSPPHSILASWAGQFVVSRKRILDNEFDAYDKLRRTFHVPPDHWLWDEGWWSSKPSDPTLGHALERSWCFIFKYSDATVAKTCGEGSGPTCQSLD